MNNTIVTTLEALQMNSDKGLEVGKVTTKYYSMVDIGISLLEAVNNNEEKKVEVFSSKISKFLTIANKYGIKSTEKYSMDKDYFPNGILTKKSMKDFSEVVLNSGTFNDFKKQVDIYIDWLLKSDHIGRYVQENVINAAKEAIVVHAPFFKALSRKDCPIKTTVSKAIVMNLSGELGSSAGKAYLEGRLESCLDKYKKEVAKEFRAHLLSIKTDDAIKSDEIKSKTANDFVKLINCCASIIIAEKESKKCDEKEAFLLNRFAKEEAKKDLEYIRSTIRQFGEFRGLNLEETVEELIKTTTKSGNINKNIPEILGNDFVRWVDIQNTKLNSVEQELNIEEELMVCSLEDIDNYLFVPKKVKFENGIAHGVAMAENKINGEFYLSKPQKELHEIYDKFDKLIEVTNNKNAETIIKKAINEINRLRWVAYLPKEEFLREDNYDKSKLMFASDGISNLGDKLDNLLQLVGKRVTLTSYVKESVKFSDTIICDDMVVGKIQTKFKNLSSCEGFYHKKTGVITKVLNSKHNGIQRVIFLLDQVETVENLDLSNVTLADYMVVDSTGRSRYKGSDVKVKKPFINKTIFGATFGGSSKSSSGIKPVAKPSMPTAITAIKKPTISSVSSVVKPVTEAQKPVTLAQNKIVAKPTLTKVNLATKPVGLPKTTGSSSNFMSLLEDEME